jgi:hypothetical protein
MDRVADELKVREERNPPYVAHLLAALAKLREQPWRGLEPSKFRRVEAAWEYADDVEDAYGFLVALAGNRMAYLEGCTFLATGTAVLITQPLPDGTHWRDVEASQAARAAGWEEQPEEVNIFLDRMRRLVGTWP